MTLLKKAFIAIFALLLTTVAVQAQKKAVPPSEDIKKDRIEKLATELDLSEDQKIEFEKINKEFDEKRKALWESNKDGDRSAMRTDMMKLREEQSVAVKGILTTEQYEKYRSLQQQNRERMRRGKAKGKGKGKGKAKDMTPKPDGIENGENE